MKKIVIWEMTLEELCEAVAEKVIEKLAESQKSRAPKPTDYLTRQEAAERLKTSLPTLTKYTKSRLIPSYRIVNTFLSTAKNYQDARLLPIGRNNSEKIREINQ
jgi:hypothetical protein